MTPRVQQRLPQLRVPLVVAPMFLVSSPQLVAAACNAGALGTFPALNARSPAALDDWLGEIKSSLDPLAAPFGINLLTHDSNKRFRADLDVVLRHRPPILISSVGRPQEIVPIVHGYGGLILADVVSLRHARLAAEAGVDGLILLCAGAGGQTGRLNPFAFVEAVRTFFDGLVLVAGGLTSGRQLHALEVMGADLGYVGTPFIATRESLADDVYRQALVDATIDDVFDTDAVSGIPANVLRSTLDRLGLNPATRWLQRDGRYDWDAITFSPDIHTAGHGVGVVRTAEIACADLVAAFSNDYGLAIPTGRGSTRQPAGMPNER